MTSSVVADPHVGRTLDPQLPDLARAFDGDAAADRFEAHADAWGWPGFGVVDTSIHHVTYQLSKRCTVTHRICLERRHERSPTFVVADVTPGAVAWRPYYLDPDIPSLQRVSMASGAERHLRRALGTGQSLKVEGVSPLRFRSSSRCVLRFDLTGESGMASMIGKVVAHQDQLGPPLDVLQSLLKVGAPIVQPLARDLDCKLLVMPDLPRGSLHDRVFAPGVALEERRSWMYALGSSLARLHGADVQLRFHPTGDDVAALSDFAPYLSRFAPELQPRFDAAADELTSLSAGDHTAVPGHGAFRTDQAMLEGDEAVIVDLDRLCSSEPARDLGNALAYLRWKAIRQPKHRTFIHDAECAFLDGYAHERPLPDPDRLRVHEAISMLKIAGRRLRNLDVDEWHLLEQLVEEAHDRAHRATASGSDRRPRETFATGHTPASEHDGISAYDRTTLPDELADALNPDTMSAAFEPLLDGTPRRVVGVDVLSVRPGRRWTIRYQLSGAGDALIGKVYADAERGRWVGSTLGRLAATAAAASDRMRVPSVLGWLPQLSMLVSVEGQGRDLAGMLLDPAVPLEGPVGSTAAWLAVFHSSDVRLDRAFNAIDERNNVRRWALVVGERYDRLRPIAVEIARALDERLAAQHFPDRAAVPIHKDFHAGHVLIGRDGVTGLDFDEMRMGDAAFDVAHFCAYAELIGCSRPLATPRVVRARTLFVEEYVRRAGGGVDLRSFDDFFAYTCLKIAWQLSIGAGLEPQPDAEEAIRQAGFMLERGRITLEQKS